MVDGPERAAAVRSLTGRLPAVLLAVALLVGAYATYAVIEAGHSGAKATWDNARDPASMATTTDRDCPRLSRIDISLGLP